MPKLTFSVVRIPRLMALLWRLCLLVTVVGSLLPAAATQAARPFPTAQTTPGADAPAYASELASLFIPALDGTPRFSWSGEAGAAIFAPNGITLTPQHDAPMPPMSLKLHFVQANPAPTLVGKTRSGALLHDYTGNDPARWQTGKPIYRSIRYDDLYPGIDLEYDSSAGQLKGTYFVATGADPSQIRWHYDGAQALTLDADSGALRVSLTDQLALSEDAPIAWQEIGGERVAVAVRYRLLTEDGRRLVGFDLGRYDRRHPLIIDPTIEFSSLISDRRDLVPADVTTDAEGNAYIVGSFNLFGLAYTELGLPAAPIGLACERGDLARTPVSCHDGFVLKYNAAGKLQYIARIGGSYNDTVLGLALDASGNLYVAGVTHSSDFPNTTGVTLNASLSSCEDLDRTRLEPQRLNGTYGSAYTDLGACAAFAARLNPTGELLLSGYLPLIGARANSVAVDSEGNPWFGGVQNNKAFVLKMNPTVTQQLFIANVFGVSNGRTAEIAIDGQGRIWAAGTVLAGPEGSAQENAFVARVPTDGSPTSVALLGNNSRGTGLALDGAGNAYVTGASCADTLPVFVEPSVVAAGNGLPKVIQTANAGGCDALVAKYKPDLSPSYVTYLGGFGDDGGVAIAAAPNGDAIVFGNTTSENFPTLDTLQPYKFPIEVCTDPFCDIPSTTMDSSTFITRLNPYGTAILVSTFFGAESYGIFQGSPREAANLDVAGGAALDKDGKIWVTGYTTSGRFPVVNGYTGCCSGGGRHGFVAKFDTSSVPVIFVPGVAASLLYDPNNNEKWLALGTQQQTETALFPDQPLPPLIAKDVIREVALISPFRKVLTGEARSGYGPFLEFMAAQGYREYEDFGLPALRQPAGCAVATQKFNSPNLFVFPYDWRLDNAVTAQKLRDYILCVRMFYPNTKVNIIAHSMGNYVTRRYLLDNPNDNFINGFISVGAPFLGGPKLVYVLETGDFGIPVILRLTILAVVGSFASAHQIIPGRAYLEQGGLPILVEAGFDLDENGTAFETYDYAKLTQVLDRRYGRSGYTPGTTARTFHDLAYAGRQDNWSQDTTGIKYFSIYGLGGVPDTVGQSIIERNVICELGERNNCVTLPVTKVRYVYGDRTVPIVSSARNGFVGDYNPPGTRKLLCQSPGRSDTNVEHTGLMSNPVVDTTLLQFLAEANGAPAKDLPTPVECGNGGMESAAARQTSAAAGEGYVVNVRGAQRVYVTDAGGNSTAPDADGVPGRVDGAVTYDLGDRQQDLILAPGTTYSLTLRSADSPIAIDITLGSDTVTSAATRYRDLVLPANVNALIRIGDSGVEALRYDADNNGDYESVVPPTAVISGDQANDTTPPSISFTSVAVGNLAALTLTAQDAAGVDQLWYSFDGLTFDSYTGTLTVDPAITPRIHAFADDGLANRAPLQTFFVPNPAAPDLTIRAAAPQQVTVGQPLTLTLTVSNVTASAATGTISVTNALPSGTAFVSANGSGWACGATNNLVTCTRPGPVAGNAALPPITVLATTQLGAFPQIYNIAKVSTAGDPNPANNSAESYVDLMSVTDIALTKTHSGDFVVGGTGIYTLTVTNIGPLPAAGPFTVTDTLPAGLTLLDASGAGWTCNSVAPAVTCVSAATLNAGSLPPLTVRATVDESALGGVVNTATLINDSVIDTNPANNSAQDTTAVVQSANLNLFMRSDVLINDQFVPFVVDTERTYQFFVSNAGPSDAQSVIVTDALPEGVSFLGDDSDQWDCQAQAQQVTCALNEPLAANTESFFRVRVGVGSQAFSQVTNTATVSSAMPDADLSNNRSEDVSPVYYGGDLQLRVSATPTFTVGADNQFVINVTNLGPIDVAQPIQINATLGALEPDQFSLPSFSGDGWTCEGLPVFASCSYPSAAVTETIPALTLNVNVTADQGARLDVSFQAFIPTLEQVIDPNRNNDFISIRRFVGIGNQAPTPQDDFANTAEDTPVTVDVLFGDFDPDNDPLSVGAVSTATHGSTALVGTTVIYTPAVNFNGADSFTYSAVDGRGGAATATVFVTVNPVNDVPLSVVLSQTQVAENLPVGALVGILSTVDVDADDSHTYSAVDGDMAAFTVSGNEVRTAAVFDFEARSSYSLTIRSQDQAGSQVDTAFLIGVGDVNEAPPVAVITVTVDAVPDSAQNFRFTGSLGTFRLDNAAPQDTDAFSQTKTFTVTAGTYTLTQQIPSTWYLTAITCPTANATVDLPGGAVALTVANGARINCTFTNERGATIRTVKYHDRNRNARRNSGEEMLPGWTMTIYTADQRQMVASAVTNDVGKANFNFLRAGNYLVCETLQSGWINTTFSLDAVLAQPCQAVTLTPGQGVTVYFGNRQTTATANEVAPAESMAVGEWIYWEHADAGDDDGYDGSTWVDPDINAPDMINQIYLPSVAR